MADLILTGASRGIGRALALALATGPHRLVLIARDSARLDTLRQEIEKKGGHALVLPADLSSVKEARALGLKLLTIVGEGVTLVHNAGVWPSRLTLTTEGLETSFATNHLAPLALQEPLLSDRRLARILVVSAGLLIKGRFDRERTPRGQDFSSLRTYANTKLCFAVAMRDVAAQHPEVDVAVMHPGVVRTDLGARTGLLGWLLERIKRGWESPETCAERLARVLAKERWSPAGDARWWVEEQESPWPAAADVAETRRAVREVSARLLGEL